MSERGLSKVAIDVQVIFKNWQLMKLLVIVLAAYCSCSSWNFLNEAESVCSFIYLGRFLITKV